MWLIRMHMKLWSACMPLTTAAEKCSRHLTMISSIDICDRALIGEAKHRVHCE